MGNDSDDSRMVKGVLSRICIIIFNGATATPRQTCFSLHHLFCEIFGCLLFRLRCSHNMNVNCSVTHRVEAASFLGNGAVCVIKLITLIKQ